MFPGRTRADAIALACGIAANRSGVFPFRFKEAGGDLELVRSFLEEHLRMEEPKGIRQEVIELIVDRLGATVTTSTPEVVLLLGEAGTGKTSVARLVAERLSTIFTDGVLVAQGRASEPTFEVLRRFLHQLGEKADPTKGVDTLSEDYQSAVSDRRVLVVLEDADQGQENFKVLIPRGSSCAVLMTGRSSPQFIGSADATRVTLEPLSSAEVREFLSGLLTLPLSSEGVEAWLHASSGNPAVLSQMAAVFNEAPSPDEFSVKGLLHRAQQRIAEAETKGRLKAQPVFDISVRPIADLPTTRDLLGVTPLVEALTRLLSDAETKLPLAIGITAPWGTGKSSLMHQLEERLKGHAGCPISRNGKPRLDKDRMKGLDRSWYTVRFPAWKYERGERIWAGLAKAIYEQPQQQMPSWWHRMLFRVRLKRERIGAFAFWAKLVVPLMLALILVVITKLAEYRVGVGVSIFAGVSAVVTVLGRYWGMISDPFRRAMDAYASRQDFRDQLGFTFEADQEIAALARVLAPPLKYQNGPSQEDLGLASQAQKKPKTPAGSTGSSRKRAVAIFVDDLDRCRTGQIVETLEAINQVFNADDQRQFAFIVGMDEEMVAANLDHEFSEVINKLSERNPSRSERFGESFLAKIVQLSVTIPEAEKDGMTRLLGEITGNAPPKGDGATETHRIDESEVEYFEQQLRGAENPADVQVAAGEALEKYLRKRVSSGSDWRSAFTNAEQALQQAIRNKRAETLSHDSADVVEAEFAVLGYLRRNPRALKRFDNAFRLQLYVANATPGCGLDFTKGELKALARWVAFSLEHPAIAKAARKSSKLMRALQSAAQNEKKISALKAYGKQYVDKGVLRYFKRMDEGPAFLDLPFDTFLEIT